MVVHSKPMDLQSPKLVLEMVHGEDTRVSRGSGASGSDGQLKTPTPTFDKRCAAESTPNCFRRHHINMYYITLRYHMSCK